MQGDTLAAARLTDGMWRLQRHLRITAFVLKDTDCATFHAVSESFPVIPELQVLLRATPTTCHLCKAPMMLLCSAPVMYSCKALLMRLCNASMNLVKFVGAGCPDCAATPCLIAASPFLRCRQTVHID